MRELQTVRDENVCRKEFTITEAVSVGLAMEKLERPKAVARKAQAKGKTRGQKNSVSSGKLPQETETKTRDKVGEAIGLSGRTYEKAKAVIESGDTELIEDRDAGSGGRCRRRAIERR